MRAVSGTHHVWEGKLAGGARYPQRARNGGTLSSWRWKYAVIAGPRASGCDTFPMSRARVWSALVREVVARGSLVKTDGWPAYTRLTKHTYAHHVTALSSSGDPAVVVMPSVHLVAALAQALAAWHLPRGRQPRAPRLLLGRVHPFAIIAGRRGVGASCSTGFLNRAFGPPTPQRLSSFLAWAVVPRPRHEITHHGTTTCRGWLS